MHTHETYMARCLELAKKGLGIVSSNPLVGSVIVFGDTIIGEGYHHTYGGAHAEVNAIQQVTNEDLLFNSTLYVNLEPCAHYGKTPPCANLIIEKKIPKVVVGCVDTFSEVAGKGIAKMREAGIEVIVNVLEKESRELNKRFFTFHEKKRPYIILKWAQSVDGFIAPTDEKHKEQRWISSKPTQVLVHKWRTEEHAILVGTQTVRKDNPSLTAREYVGRNPIRIVINPSANLAWNAYSVFNTDAQTIVYNSVENYEKEHVTGVKIEVDVFLLDTILADLYQRNIPSVLVEGGAQTIQHFIDSGKYDEVRIIEGNTYLQDGVKAPVVSDKLTWEISSYGEDKLSIGLR